MSLDLKLSRGGVDFHLHCNLSVGVPLLDSFDQAVVELRSQLAALDSEDFELVDGQDSQAPDPASVASATPEPATSGSTSGGEGPSWGDRLEYARLCGEAACRVLAGQRGNWPSDLGHSLANRHYVLLRDCSGAVPAGGYTLYSRWADIKDLVQEVDPSSGRRTLANSSVFKAWPSLQEARVFLAATRVATRLP
jgi:hypothetical protein